MLRKLDGVLLPILFAGLLSVLLPLVLRLEKWKFPRIWAIIVTLLLLTAALTSLSVVFDASKATEPWGFLLGDVTDGEDVQTNKSVDQLSFFAKAWRMIKRM